MGESGSSRNVGSKKKEPKRKQRKEHTAEDQSKTDEETAEEVARYRGSLFGTRVSVSEARRRRDWLEGKKEKRASISSRPRGAHLHEVPFHEEFHGLYSLCYSPGGDVFACGFGNGNIQVRWSENGALKLTVRTGSGQSSVPIMWCRFDQHKGDLFYAASACGTVFSCNSVTGEFTRFVKEEKNEVNALDIDQEGRLLVTAGRDCKVRVYDVPTEKVVNIYQQSATMGAVEPCFRGVHSERVFAVRYHPQLQFVFLTGGWDNAVKVWDSRQKRNCVNTFFGPHICGDAIDIKTNTVVTGAWAVENSLQIWDMRTFQKIEDISPTNRVKNNKGEFLYVAKFFDGDPYGDMVLLGGSGMENAEVVSLQEKKVLGSWKTGYPVHSVDSYRNSIVFGGTVNTMNICEFV